MTPAGPSHPDVLVVGAGPAGSTVAGLLAARGLSVVAVDRARFPRPKPCGECLNPGALAALERMQMLDPVLAAGGAPLHGWAVSGEGGRAAAVFGSGLRGLGMERSVLDDCLLEQARARGALVLEGARVEDVSPALPQALPEVRIRCDDGSRTFRPRVVVGADGLRSRVARSAGLTGRAPRLRKASFTFRLEWVRPASPGPSRGSLSVTGAGTLGLAPVSADHTRWNATLVVAAGAAARRVAVDPCGAVLSALDRTFGPDPRRRIVGGPWTSGPFDQPVPRPWAPGVVLVGDAAGYYDPFTGQGIYRALRGAELAAEAVAECLGTPESAWRPLARYARTLDEELRGPRRLQSVVEGVMARPFLRERLLPRLHRSGALRTLICVTGDAAPLSLLAHPAWWGPLVLGGARPGPPLGDAEC